MRYEILHQGTVLNTINAEDDSWVAAHYAEWRRVDEPIAPSTEPRLITRYALLNRFTTPELVAIEQAKDTSAELRVFTALVNAAQYIDLDEPKLASGLAMLEQAGLLAAGRAEEIINAPIQPKELP